MIGVHLKVYQRPGRLAARFEAESRERVFERGICLPGRVWATGGAVFIPDLVADGSLPRGPIAVAEGLHCAVGFPIAIASEFLGVMEFFDERIRQSDGDLLRMMTVLGSQIGQFIERRRAEAAVRDSEQRFRLMADAVPSMIWTAAPDGTITYANDRWFEYCGRRPEQNARPLPELVVHPEDRERSIAAWTAALRQGTPYEIEVRNRRHDGVYRWFVTRAVPLRDAEGHVTQWVGTTNDIEHQKRTEQTTHFLAEASSALVSLANHESTLQQVASLAVPPFADWCAVDAQESDGRIHRIAVAHTDPRKVELVRELGRRYSSWPSQQRGEVEWATFIPDQMLVEWIRDEEHLRIVRELGFKSYISVPLRSHGRVLGAITFVSANSGRVYEPADVQGAEDLASRVVIAMENVQLLAKLQEADRRKDEFLAMLAHELRNPLAPIRNAAQILRAKAPSVRELQWANDVIERQVLQMTRLVDDLLDVSRITRGKLELRRQQVELASVVGSAIEASRPLIEKWGHQLEVTIPPEPICLDADPARLAQVFSNILTNAAKYTDHGGHIRIAVEPQADHVVIRVQDNGIGISKEALPRIFDMFTQLPNSLERSEGGLGVGLTLVRRLVELHGGAVEARSDGPGKGSEFIVRLQRAIGSHRPHGRAGASEHLLSPPRRILVVDDNLDAADSLGMLLTMMGNEIQTAHDGLEAVKLAAEFHPDIVLMDLGLPKLSGFEAARRIRAQEGGRATLLVALTGWGQEGDRRRSQDSGFDHHLTKPVEFESLQRLLAGDGARERDTGWDTNRSP